LYGWQAGPDLLPLLSGTFVYMGCFRAGTHRVMCTCCQGLCVWGPCMCCTLLFTSWPLLAASAGTPTISGGWGWHCNSVLNLNVDLVQLLKGQHHNPDSCSCGSSPSSCDQLL